MEFQDKILSCVDCGAEFVWTAGEQLFFADKNFKNEPKRCKACKAKRAARAASPGVRERVETTATCSACGKETTVPFRPTQGRPVFCKECFQQRKFAGAGGHRVLPLPDRCLLVKAVGLRLSCFGATCRRLS
jgi:CxxC-x17-CxxC domain-containing protein